jgi:prevent-host-death family protein
MLTRKTRSKKMPPPGTWKLQDAKARFSEVVRLAQTEGPQRVTVHDREAVVIVDAGQYANSDLAEIDRRTGYELVLAMQEARKLGLKLKPLRVFPKYRPPVNFSGSRR